MLHIPISRWGEPYKSLEADKVVHFATGEVLAEVSRANGGLVERDMRFAQRARNVLRDIPIKDLLQLIKKAAGVAKGSGEPHKTKVAKLSREQVLEIARQKMEDLNANDEEMAARIIAGTARSMGITIKA